ncbi:MAG: hypothetical protein ACJ76V_04705 [Thermoleophilaceae bacterium]
MAAKGSFAFVQLEFGFVLGPDDGRYVTRSGPGTAAERVVVISTLNAPKPAPRLTRRRRPKQVAGAEAPVMPLARVTMIHAGPFANPADARSWLGALVTDSDALHFEVDSAVRDLNRVLRAHRAAASDPYARDVSAAQAIAVRVGYGDGDQVADGNYTDAYEMPRDERRRKRSELLLPNERLAAVLAGREDILAAEELVLRARADVDAGRPREAALQVRVALEALLAELGADQLGERRAEIEARRPLAAEAANAALAGEVPAELSEAVAETVALLESALARVRAKQSAGS